MMELHAQTDLIFSDIARRKILQNQSQEATGIIGEEVRYNWGKRLFMILGIYFLIY